MYPVEGPADSRMDFSDLLKVRWAWRVKYKTSYFHVYDGIEGSYLIILLNRSILVYCYDKFFSTLRKEWQTTKNQMIDRWLQMNVSFAVAQNLL